VKLPQINRVLKRENAKGVKFWRVVESHNKNGKHKSRLVKYWGKLPTDKLDELIAAYNKEVRGKRFEKPQDFEVVGIILARMEYLKRGRGTFELRFESDAVEHAATQAATAERNGLTKQFVNKIVLKFQRAAGIPPQPGQRGGSVFRPKK